MTPRLVPLPGVDVACWDSGGAGEAVVLMHAAWGSGEHWAPQLRSLAGAGYRVIAWSRRGHHGSGTGSSNDPGTMGGDLEALADALDLGAFHLVGTALGAFGAIDFALGQQDRLLSLTLVASLCGLTDADFVAETRRLVPPSFEQLPIELRELSAAYRLASPAGTRLWRRLTARAVTERVHQPPEHVITRSALCGLRLPTLFLTGDADPYMPPARMRTLANCVPGSTYATIRAAGHSPAWENQAAFDANLTGFLAG